MYQLTAPLILASGSPRRKELLHGIGIMATVIPSHIDESLLPYQEAESYVTELARQKAESVAQQHPESAVLAADTIVLYDNQVLGKPRDKEDACTMLQKLSGSVHEVWGGIALSTREGMLQIASCTTVYFRTLSPALIQAYVESGESDDKAGAYAMQAKGACFVEKIEGSHTNVIGLDLVKTISILDEQGIIAVKDSKELSNSEC